MVADCSFWYKYYTKCFELLKHMFSLPSVIIIFFFQFMLFQSSWIQCQDVLTAIDDYHLWLEKTEAELRHCETVNSSLSLSALLEKNTKLKVNVYSCTNYIVVDTKYLSMLTCGLMAHTCQCSTVPLWLDATIY